MPRCPERLGFNAISYLRCERQARSRGPVLVPRMELVVLRARPGQALQAIRTLARRCHIPLVPTAWASGCGPPAGRAPECP